MPPAATLTSQTAHPPPPLGTPFGPGPGSPNIFIGGKPALRAGIDFHACPVPGSPPHGGGFVGIGSSTVFFNNMSAVRVSDQIIEAGGPPNSILTGENTVLIG
jgi:uncharacterized Zn-binding protein involved in type VI secretion